MVIINPNAPSVSNLGSNRADGQVESTQVDARQSQSARRPEVAQQPTATQAANAAPPAQHNNAIPLLNNRDQAVSNAIQRNSASNNTVAEALSNQQAAAETARLNQAQAQATPDTLQRLADAAQQRVDTVQQSQQSVAAAAQQRSEEAAEPAPAVDIEINENAAVPPTVGFGAEAPVAEQAPPLPQPTPAFQVLQNSQQRLNEILLPDFANFIGLRASVPAQAQAEGQLRVQETNNQTEEAPPPPPKPVDVKV